MFHSTRRFHTLPVLTAATMLIAMAAAQAQNRPTQPPPNSPIQYERELRVVDSKNRIIGIVSDITDYGAVSVPFYHPVVFQNKTTLVRYYLTFYRDEVFAYHSAYYTEADCTGQAMAFMPDRDSSMVHNAAFGKPGKTIMVPIPGAPLYKGTVVSSWDPYTQECDNFDPYPPEDETEHTWMSPLTPVGNFDDWYTKPYAPN